MLLAGTFTFVVVVSSDTAEVNTTNNAAVSRARRPAPRCRHCGSASTAPRSGRVGVPLSYRVSATAGSERGASFVRLRAPPDERLTDARGGRRTFSYRGARCRDYQHVARGRTVGFAVTVVPAGSGRLPATAAATALNLPSPARASARIQVSGSACASALRRARC